MTSTLLDPLPPQEAVDLQLELFEQAQQDPDFSPKVHVLTWSSPGIIIGRFQKKEEVVNLEASKQLGIPVVRRFTGGGAVLVGPDQLGVFFVGREDAFPQNIPTSMEVLSTYIVQALRMQRCTTEVRAPNDIQCHGKKVSGSAQARSRGAVLHHATLILEFDPEIMDQMLVEDEKISERWNATTPAGAVTSLSRCGFELDVGKFVEDIEDIMSDVWTR